MWYSYGNNKMIYGFNLTTEYALDFGLFYKVRNFKDGLTFFEFILNLDLYKADHNPQVRCALVIFNFTIFDITFYNVRHYDSYL
jgi:hypothetical protein